MRRRLILALGMTALLVASLPGAALAKSPSLDAGASAKKFTKTGVYIVRMADAPVVAYEGGIAGLPATKPAKGQKIDPLSDKVVKYVAYLDDTHAKAMATVGATKQLYSYRYSFNGFSARLTGAQASKLLGVKGVVSVTPDTKQKLDTSRTPTFLGLDAAGGLWEQLGGPSKAGEGVIVGILDSGIWPESQSVSDRDANGKLIFQQIPGWHGKCTPGELFPASKCNQKLIGAQWFGAGWGGKAGIKASFAYEYWSARDADGHGTHTSTTAAGNYGVTATVDGGSFGTISGMAPRARIATYKVCWGRGDEGGCFNSDSIAAIDQAVADGVDVLNYSISGTSTNFLDPVEVAFLFAADAGVFVSASAGNAGPSASTVAHPSPWLTTTAAGTHDRSYPASVTLGNGASYSGQSSGSGAGPASLVYSEYVAKAGADATEAALCYPGTLDPAKVTGKIVFCFRGVIARTDKSKAVKEAGGVGMIMGNTGPNSINADIHYVPTIHVSHTDGFAILDYIDANVATATATIGAGTATFGSLAPDVASFSSRGPLLASSDLLKPDIMAPGVDVLAAVSPAGSDGRNFDFLSGTSMSSPHMAGLGALLTDAYPGWSPAAMKSALMTTASQTRNDGSAIPGNPFGYGAGQVAPSLATDPGLVYNAGWNDWLAFLCGTAGLSAGTCSTLQGLGYSTDPSDHNYPSITIGSLAGSQTVKRTVTNVGGAAATYTASVQAPAGIDVTVTPASFTIAAGAKKTFEVTFTTTSAATLNAYAFGALTWSDGDHTVRSPLTVRPVALAAPTQVSGTGGAISYEVGFGYAGSFSATARGLVPAAMTDGNVLDDPNDSFSPTGQGITTIDVVIPAGTTYARFSLFDEYTDGNDDLDLYVYRGSTLVGASGSGTSAEEVNLLNPTAATYRVYVHGWQTDGPDANFTLFTWLLGSDDAGNMTVTAPATASIGATGTIELTFSGLAAGTKYLGSVAYAGSAGMPNPTIVRVDTP
jgi:hypothetical protein